MLTDFSLVNDLKGRLKLESDVTVLFEVHSTHFNGRVFDQSVTHLPIQLCLALRRIRPPGHISFI